MTVLTDRLSVRLEAAEARELAFLARANGRGTSEEIRVAVGLHLEAERARQGRGGRA